MFAHLLYVVCVREKRRNMYVKFFLNNNILATHCIHIINQFSFDWSPEFRPRRRNEQIISLYFLNIAQSIINFLFGYNTAPPLPLHPHLRRCIGLRYRMKGVSGITRRQSTSTKKKCQTLVASTSKLQLHSKVKLDEQHITLGEAMRIKAILG